MITLDDYKNEQMKDADFAKEYNTMQAEFNMIRAEIDRDEESGVSYKNHGQQLRTAKNISRM